MLPLIRLGYPPYDCQIHTTYSNCASKQNTVKNIIAMCEQRGITRVAITDHLNHSLPDYKKYVENTKRQMNSIRTKITVTIAPELCLYGDKLSVDDELLETFDYVFAGIHELKCIKYDLSWPVEKVKAFISENGVKKIIDENVRSIKILAANKKVHVLSHPLRGLFYLQCYGYPALTEVESHYDEIASIVGKYEKIVDVSSTMPKNTFLKYPSFDPSTVGRAVRSYIQFLYLLYRKGVRFSISSDAHTLQDVGDTTISAWLLKEAGVPTDRVVYPADILRHGALSPTVLRFHECP